MRVLRREVHARSKIALRPLPLRKGIFEGVFIAVFLTSIPFQSKVPMARPGCSRVGGALVMAASSVLGYIGQARVPFWSSDDILWALHAIFSPLSCYRNGCFDRLHEWSRSRHESHVTAVDSAGRIIWHEHIFSDAAPRI